MLSAPHLIPEDKPRAPAAVQLRQTRADLPPVWPLPARAPLGRERPGCRQSPSDCDSEHKARQRHEQTEASCSHPSPTASLGAQEAPVSARSLPRGVREGARAPRSPCRLQPQQRHRRWAPAAGQQDYPLCLLRHLLLQEPAGLAAVHCSMSPSPAALTPRLNSW